MVQTCGKLGCTQTLWHHAHVSVWAGEGLLANCMELEVSFVNSCCFFFCCASQLSEWGLLLLWRMIVCTVSPTPCTFIATLHVPVWKAVICGRNMLIQ